MSPRTRTGLSLLVVLAATAFVWMRATGVMYTGDDYQYLHHFAPMRGLGDFFKQFVTADPNAEYWRPLASGLAVIDFLNWGWDGRGFHVTNLIIHLLTTGAVFIAARRVFKLSETKAFLAALLFGISAAHEGNILWAAGRTDSLATLFLLLALLCAIKETLGSRRRLWNSLGVLATLASLCSKEIGFAVVPLVFLLPTGERSIRPRVIRTLPYLIATVAFFLYRMPFTAPITSTEILSGGAVHSVRLLFQNAIYAIGYTILPLDLQQAMSIIAEKGMLLIAAVGIVCLAIGTLAWLVLRSGRWKRYLFPLAFVALTGGLTMLAFERWRVYMMSVGVFVLLVSFLADAYEAYRPNWSRLIFPSILFLILLFHAYRSVTATTEWQEATRELQHLKSELRSVLAQHPGRPVRFLFLDRPGKLGSAPVMQLSIDDVLSQAELERTHSPLLPYGGATDTLSINSETATMLIATNAGRGFEGIGCQSLGNGRYDLSVASGSSTVLQPSITKEAGIARRDQRYEEGDTLHAPFADVVLTTMRGAYAEHVMISVHDTSLIPLFFDGARFLILE